MNNKTKQLYIKATKRLRWAGIIDPTTQIAVLEEEIDGYRQKIHSMEGDDWRLTARLNLERIEELEAELKTVRGEAAAAIFDDIAQKLQFLHSSTESLIPELAGEMRAYALGRLSSIETMQTFVVEFRRKYKGGD